VLLAGAWAFLAWLLWRSRVPGDLELPHVEPRDFFSARELARTARYERFLRIDGVLSLVALLAALAFFARRGAAFTRESAAGRVGTGMLLGMLAFAVVWLAQLPFGLAALWWERRYGQAKQGYVEWAIANWLALGGTFLFVCLAIVIVMGLATLLGRRWWIPGAPAFVGLAILFAFLQPYLVVQDARPVREPWLRSTVQRLERQEGISGTPVRVLKVSGDTKEVNAFATGVGSSSSVFLYDTFLDGRFTHGEVAVVLAHEFGHVARKHIWKGLAWYALFAIPGAYLVTRAVRRFGGLTEPAAIPPALFVLVLLQILALPVQNVVSRHVEAEADWIALQTTRDPASARRLFQAFSRTSLQQPRPPTWDYLLFENHPTIVQRLAMVEAWRRRGTSPQSGSDVASGGPSTSMPTSPPIVRKASRSKAGRAAKRSKKRSIPDGVNMTMIRAGSEPTFWKQCGVPLGTKTNEPRGA
jgi:STE24 endopeptidase